MTFEIGHLLSLPRMETTIPMQNKRSQTNIHLTLWARMISRVHVFQFAPPTKEMDVITTE